MAMAAEFAFVSWGPDGNGADGRFKVRSHCMKGRNKRDGSRRSVQQAKRAIKNATQTQKTQTAARLRPYPIATLVPQVDPTFVQFADGVGTTPQELLHHVITFDNVINATYAFESCIDFGTNDNNNLAQWPSFDVSFFHTILLVTSASRDVSQSRPLAPGTRFHLAKALSFLNEQLSDSHAYLQDSTLYTIICLAGIAGSLGDYDTADAHISGLRHIVSLRGGLQQLEESQPMLRFKLESLDLVWCLSTGGATRFLAAPTSWEPSITNLTPPTDLRFSLALMTGLFDARLIDVFHDLQQLMIFINENYERNRRLSVDKFQPVISSTQSRLFYLKDVLKDPPSQCLCLGMLAFLTTMLRFPGRNLSYTYLNRRLQRVHRCISPTDPRLRPLVLWLAIVYRITFVGKDAWLLENWKAAAEPDWTWAEVREQVQKVIWIRCIHDESGERAFALLRRGD